MYASYPTLREHVGLVGMSPGLSSIDRVAMPGNPGAYRLANGQTTGVYDQELFLKAMANGEGHAYVAFAQAHNLPVAYGNPTTDKAWLEHYGYSYKPASTATNPIYSVDFAKTANLPANSDITPGSGSNYPSTTPITVDPSLFSPGGGGGTGTYTNDTTQPAGGINLTNLLNGDNKVLLIAAAVGAMFLLRK
jgi:hypothetical protein